MIRLVDKKILQGQEAIFKALNAIPAPVCLVDQNLVIRYTNPAFANTGAARFPMKTVTAGCPGFFSAPRSAFSSTSVCSCG